MLYNAIVISSTPIYYVLLGSNQHRVATRLTFRQYIDISDDEQYHNIPVKNIVTFSVQLKFPSLQNWAL